MSNDVLEKLFRRNRLGTERMPLMRQFINPTRFSTTNVNCAVAAYMYSNNEIVASYKAIMLIPLDFFLEILKKNYK